MLLRIGVSLEDVLLKRFDGYIAEHGYTNRSEAIRDLIREKLIMEDWSDPNSITMGLAMLVYDHHASDLGRRLERIQHNHFHQVLSTTHIHIDHDNCLEIVVLKGRAEDIRTLAHSMTALKGVKCGRFVPATTGQGLR